MGYTTVFNGEIKFSKKLTPNREEILINFSTERHGGGMDAFEGMPGFWCNWVPTKNRNALEWNGAEKFYNYVEWLEYLIKNYFEPWKIKLNGKIEYCGESGDDNGVIIVKDSIIKVVTMRELIEAYENRT